jgi:hypothetical protein
MTFTSTGIINYAIKSSEQYVTFLINTDTYVIELLKVKKIAGMTVAAVISAITAEDMDISKIIKEVENFRDKNTGLRAILLTH